MGCSIVPETESVWEAHMNVSVCFLLFLINYFFTFILIDK